MALLDQRETKQRFQQQFQRDRARRLEQQFPDLQDQDLQKAQSDPDQLVKAVAEFPGQNIQRDRAAADAARSAAVSSSRRTAELIGAGAGDGGLAVASPLCHGRLVGLLTMLSLADATSAVGIRSEWTFRSSCDTFVTSSPWRRSCTSATQPSGSTCRSRRYRVQSASWNVSSGWFCSSARRDMSS